MKSFQEFLNESAPQPPEALKHPWANYQRSYGSESLGISAGKPVHEYNIPHENVEQVKAGLHQAGYKQIFANHWANDEHVIDLSYRGYKPKYTDPAQHKIKYDEGEKWR